MRGLLETFDACTVLMVALFACAYLARGKEIMSTGLGGVVLTFGALYYLSRAAEEFIWLGGSIVIASICAAMGPVQAVLLLRVRRNVPQPV